jgi:hypothetical protein
MSEEKAATLFEQAIADAAAPKGRYVAQGEVRVVGHSAVPLPAPLWSADPCGTEPPLGEDVNWLPDMTTVSGLPREQEEKNEVQAQFNRRGL